MEPALDLCPAWCVWLAGCWITRPDQTAAIVDHRMRVEQSIFHVCEILVIQIELPLESAISEAPLALEHGDRLVEELLKSHCPPSLGQANPTVCAAPAHATARYRP